MGSIGEWALRGRLFDQAEKQGWIDGDWLAIAKEAPVVLIGGRRGRVDVLVEVDDSRVVVEAKATDWDSIAAPRVRPNVQRHIRQLMRYASAFLERGEKVHPALVYPRSPSSLERKLQIEGIAHDAFVQVVWREAAPSLLS